MRSWVDKVRKLFERLTSGRTGSPETRDLRERGRWGWGGGERVDGMQCERNRPGGKKDRQGREKEEGCL